MNDLDRDILMHYGVKRRSGRYPWGSGENPYQHSGDFIARVDELRSQGLSEVKIAEAMKMSTTDLRMQLRVANHQRRELEADRARSLRADGLSLAEIAKRMGYKNDSSIRSLLNENTAVNKNKAKVTAEKLKAELEEKGFLDIGAGVERELGISRNTLQEAAFILETEGYSHFGIGRPQVTNPKRQTIVEVIAKNPDGKEQRELQKMLYDDPALLKNVGEYHSDDNGLTYTKLKPPSSMSSERVMVRYGDQGGKDMDGVIQIRPGVDDLSLGKSHYAQVRIMVDGTHYLKGMAMYSDDIPDGYDIVFNTNKKSGTPKEKVFKEVSGDPENPFGATIKAGGQYEYKGKDGKMHLSPVNKLKEEGDWDKMARNLSSQFLSKQPVKLIQQQLGITYKSREDEFNEIMSLNNPTVKKKLLLDFADECDGAAVHLKAASFPRQSMQVILPLPKLSDKEIYAPNYNNGETVALVRYPHAGIFEIPVLKVNNNNPQGRSVMKGVTDAVGINPKVAEQLSGADFDGDTVAVIPITPKSNIKSAPPLAGLKDFEPKDEYAERPGMKYMTKQSVQKQMGTISNLITDMTLGGASEQELVRAVKHSMVVIDAYKHKLDYTRSEKVNGIAELQKKYQGYNDPETGKRVGGASTLMSKRKQTIQVPERRGSPYIDAETGKLQYKTSGRTYIDPKTGKVMEAKTKVSRLLETPDLHTLTSGTKEEAAYADYGNKCKALANRARKAYKATGNLEQKAEAKVKYSTEVASLESKLNIAAMNAPRERRANAIALSKVKAQIQANPELEGDKKAIKKLKQQAITLARESVGASGKGTRITIEPKEWEAIQAGAISDNKLSQILRYADMDKVRDMATPKAAPKISQAQISRAKAMASSGKTMSEIADALGISVSTVSKYVS